MRKRRLGRTDIEVSELGLGSLFASSLGPGFDESKAAVHRAVELGINFIDTAPAYADAEATLGRILKDVKAPLIVSTKFGGRPWPFHPRDKDALCRSFEDSLTNLHRDTVDILFIHEPDRPLQYNWFTDPESVYGPVIEVLDELKEKGLIRFTGLGGTTTTEMCHCMRSGRFDVVLTAFNYSALFREAAIELLPLAKQLNMGVVLGSVLQQGGLGRRYDDEVRQRPAWMSKPRQEQLLAFYEFLDELDMSIVELGLRFAISNPDVSTALAGFKTARHVDEAVGYVNKGPLSPTTMANLDQIAAMVPFRPFEEPMLLPLGKPYYGPGLANLGMGVKVGTGHLK